MARGRGGSAGLGSLFFLIVLLLGGLSLGGSAQVAVTDLAIRILGEAPLTGPGGGPILVAGIWHELSVNLSAVVPSVAINATLPGATPDGIRTTYRWTWEGATGTWSDPLYGMFIRPDLSRADGPRLTFVIGVDAQALPGPWRFDIFEGNTSLTNFDVAVQAPVLSYALSAADFRFQVEPFTAASLSSRPSAQYIRVANQGNVPLRLAVSFDLLQGELSVENPMEVAHVYGEARYYVRLAASPRPPSIIEVQGLSRIEALYVVPSSGAATIIPSIEGTFSLTLQVGRSGYAVQVVRNVVFQTLDSIQVDYGEIATWQVYLTGEQNVSLAIEASNARLVGAFAEGQPLSFPATLAVTGNRELPVTVQVEADRPGIATVEFRIRLLTTGDERSFTTTIAVRGGPPASDQTVTYFWILGSVAAALVFGFVGISQWRARRMATARRPLSRPKRTSRTRGRMPNERPREGYANDAGGNPVPSKTMRTARSR